MLGQRILSDSDADLIDGGGIGGTLAGYAMASAAAKATLSEILTPEAFERMLTSAERFSDGDQTVISSRSLPWYVVRLGARAEYRFCPDVPRNGAESYAADDTELDGYLHLYTVNRGSLITPCHNMALMCPDTSIPDVDLHSRVFGGRSTSCSR